MHPPGPFPPAHLDACHEDPALEPPRWRARAQLFTRPAADAGPWRRAARALPACERGKGRRRGWGGGGSGQGRRQGVAAGGSARGALRAAWGCVGWSWGRGPCRWGKGVEGRWRGRLYQPSSLGIAGPFPGPWRPVLGGRGVPGDGAWHWDVRPPDTVSTPPIGSARALSSGASHPAPSPWVELGSTQGVVWCGVVWCGVVWCGVVWCGVAKVLLPNGNLWDALQIGNAKLAGLCIWCVSAAPRCSAVSRRLRVPCSGGHVLAAVRCRRYRCAMPPPPFGLHAVALQVGAGGGAFLRNVKSWCFLPKN